MIDSLFTGDTMGPGQAPNTHRSCGNPHFMKQEPGKEDLWVKDCLVSLLISPPQSGQSLLCRTE